MDQKALVVIEVIINEELFSFNMPMNGKSTYAQALEAAKKIVSDLETFNAELDAKKEAQANETQPLEGTNVPEEA